MTVPPSKKTATFNRPLVLGGFDEVLPAGVYSVETDEELLEGISFPDPAADLDRDPPV